MRNAPGSIPDKMPTLEAAIKNIVYLMDKPRDRLKGYSIAELVHTYSDGSPKWLTGSTVWLPAVFGQVDENTDLDIVFANKDSSERFLNGAMGVLGGYTKTTNTWGSGRILHPDGSHVIDVWSLEDDESIEELLLTYPSEYQRCAYFMTWSGASPGYLTRIIKKRIRIRQTTGGYGRARPAPQPVGMLGGMGVAPRVTAPTAAQATQAVRRTGLLGETITGLMDETITVTLANPQPQYGTYTTQYGTPIRIQMARDTDLDPTIWTAVLDEEP